MILRMLHLVTRKVYPTQSIGVINIDAHFDRLLKNNLHLERALDKF